MAAFASAERAIMVRAARFSATAGSTLTTPGAGCLAPPPHAALIKNAPRIKRRMTILPTIVRSWSRDGTSRAIARLLPERPRVAPRGYDSPSCIGRLAHVRSVARQATDQFRAPETERREPSPESGVG